MPSVKDIYTVARFDYRNLVRSAPGVIFLVLYLVMAVQLGTSLIDLLQVDKLLPPGAKGSAEQVQAALNTQLAQLVSWFLPGHDEAVRHLVFERPIVMSAYFLLSLLLVPILVLLLAFNQISGYVSRGSIRYLLLKTGRLELYLGLFLSNLVFFLVLSGALTAIMTAGFALAIPRVSALDVILFSVRIFVAIALSAVPLIAFMSMVAAMLGSPLGTVFLGVGAYAFVDIAGALVARQTEYGKIFFYVLPLEVKYWFAYPGVGHFLAATGLMLVYTAGYLLLGWLFLRRRNV